MHGVTNRFFDDSSVDTYINRIRTRHASQTRVGFVPRRTFCLWGIWTCTTAATYRLGWYHDGYSWGNSQYVFPGCSRICSIESTFGESSAERIMLPEALKQPVRGAATNPRLSLWQYYLRANAWGTGGAVLVALLSSLLGRWYRDVAVQNRGPGFKTIRPFNSLPCKQVRYPELC